MQNDHIENRQENEQQYHYHETRYAAAAIPTVEFNKPSTGLNNAPFERLLSVLSVARPYGGTGEAMLIDALMRWVPGVCVDAVVERDRLGSLFVTVFGRGGARARTLFTAHVDTAHPKDAGVALVVNNDGYIMTDDATCLGADDGAGVWVLMQMIAAHVPGTYAFFVGGEKLHQGSRYFAAHYRNVLEEGNSSRAYRFGKFDRCIAFDQEGKTSVVTVHSNRRAASDAFAQTLANKLTQTMDGNWRWKLDPHGIDSNSAILTHLIPECPSISVGFKASRTPRESLDVYFLQDLALTCCEIDWEKL